MDLREFIEKCEKANELKGVKKEIDWNLELSHVSIVNDEKDRYALLFENIKDYKNPVLTGAFSSKERLAIALGMKPGTSMCEMSREWMKLSTKKHIPPVKVKTGPILDRIVEGNNVNLFDFPVPFMYPGDGGRFIGTTHYLVTKDPETGWVNCGTYRMQVLDEKSCGIQIIKGKHADFMLKKYQKMGKKMPALMVIGGDPLGFLTGSALISAGISEFDIMGTLRKEPIEIIESEYTGLPFDKNAEIVLEGEIETDPEKFRQEGPLGEYTGYYSGKKSDEWPKPWLDVKRVYTRSDYIFWSTMVGKPITDTHMIQSLNRTATLWTDLENMKIPGIQSVYIPPESTGRFWAIVSVKQMYPGHANQIGTAVISTTTGHYGLKGVIVVDEDIAADDWDKVFWALSVRFDPRRDTQIINRGRSTPLDPALPIENREIVSRIIMDACVPYEWKRKPKEIFLDKKTAEVVRKNWDNYGI